MAVSYMKNFILKFDNTLVEDASNIIENTEEQTTVGLNCPVYDWSRIAKLKKIIDRIDQSWIRQIKVPNNMTIEKISYDLYGTCDYWDILIILNSRRPLFDMSYDYDVISEAGETATKEYENFVFKKKLQDTKPGKDGMTTRERFRISFQEESTKNNDKSQVIYYIEKSKIYNFINMLYEEDMM